MAESRGYQQGFYELSPAVRDAESRARRAAKIRMLLERYVSWPLAEAACLDIGCSSGLISASLAPLFRTVIGVEYDALALGATTHEGRAAVRFIRGDAMALPLASASIDVVLCAQVYEHVPDDTRLAEEVYRVLKPAGVVFFSGPNWLFPIELHYNLPFIHWLPAPLADATLRILRRGDHYYERSRSMWGLRSLWQRFELQDVTLDVLDSQLAASTHGAARLGRRLPPWVWRVTLPFFPNFNWLLWKRA